MTTSTVKPGFDETEVRETLHSLVGTLEDADLKKRAYAYTEDATFLMSGAAPVHGREEMFRRLETGTLLSSIKITPRTIEGDGRFAYVYGDFACLAGPTHTGPGTPMSLYFLTAQGAGRRVENCAGVSLSRRSAKQCDQRRLTRGKGAPAHAFYSAAASSSPPLRSTVGVTRTSETLAAACAYPEGNLASTR